MDWKTVLAEIRASGLTQAEIAERVSVTQSVVSDLCKGKNANPSFALGSALLGLHKKRSKQPAKAA